MSKVQNAIILLAGFGSRLRPLTDNTHKALINIGNATILERQIRQLADHGVQNFHLVLGYRGDDVKAYCQNHLSQFGDFIFYDNPLYQETNNAYSLLQAFQNFTDTFLLLDGDVVLDDGLIKNLCQSTDKSLLLCDTDPAKLNEEAMKVKINGDDTIIEISKNIPLANASGESIGVSLYQKDWATKLKDYLTEKMQNKDSWQIYYEDAIQKILDLDEAPSPLTLLSTLDFKWTEIDDHKDLEDARKLFG